MKIQDFIKFGKNDNKSTVLDLDEKLDTVKKVANGRLTVLESLLTLEKEYYSKIHFDYTKEDIEKYEQLIKMKISCKKIITYIENKEEYEKYSKRLENLNYYKEKYPQCIYITDISVKKINQSISTTCWSINFNDDLSENILKSLTVCKIEPEDVYLSVYECYNYKLTSETLKDVENIDEYNKRTDRKYYLYMTPKLFMYHDGNSEKGQEQHGNFLILHLVNRNDILGYLILNAKQDS